jgi:hypothetical protein
MAVANHQPVSSPDVTWHPIDTVPAEAVHAWVRWHDSSQGITPLAIGRDAIWWGTHGATHWRLLSDAEMAAYNGLGRYPTGT